MSAPLLAAPACYVDIYPFEGGVYTISGDNALLRSVTVDKNIRGSQGTFAFTMLPGGPFGLNARPGWVDILTPMSLVVITMSRAGVAQIVMIGIVRTVSQTEVWTPGKGVQRVLQVAGADFAYFFSLSNYYTQSLLNASLGSPLGVTGALTAIDAGLVAGTPDAVGRAWYEKIMAGPQSLMASLTFAYQGTRLSFFQLVTTWFEKYTQADIDIPLGDNFMTADGAWNQKFNDIFPFPWYEFFVTTAPVGTYPESQRTGLALSPLTGPQVEPASPQLVARVNPLPRLVNTGSTASPKFEMDFSLWDALDTFTLDTDGPFQSSIQFDDSEVRNFYVINPMWLSNQFGVTNDMQTPFTFLFASWVDTASLHRYGYRPEISELHWFSDSNGVLAQQNAENGVGIPGFETMVADLALKKISQHEPTPLMAKGSATTNLRPDILPGNKFIYAPFKDAQTWAFYIEGVSHSWSFGSNCTTSVTLTRGLPTATYDSDDLMVALHTGNAQRINGDYVVGLPPGLGPALQPLNYNNMAAVTGGIASIFAQPQAS